MQASTREGTIDVIGERQTGEQGPKNLAMFEMEVCSLCGSAQEPKRLDTSTVRPSVGRSSWFKCVATCASHNLIAKISSLRGCTKSSKWEIICC
jgi:hypothetical protein